MTLPKLGIIISTTRDQRFGDRPAAWIREIAAARGDLDVSLLDLREFSLPFFDEPVSPAFAPPAHPEARRWAETVDGLDALVIVTAEYNRGPPAVLKNALDYAYAPFNRKPVGFVGYGGVGAARAVEQLRLNAIELQMAPIRPAVHIAGQEFVDLLMNGAELSAYPHLAAAATTMLDDLVWWTAALRTARAAGAGA